MATNLRSRSHLYKLVVSAWLSGVSLPLACTSVDDGDASSSSDHENTGPDPFLAPRAEIDRFSGAAGHLLVRTPDNGLPRPGQPIDFDVAPFVTKGFSPAGSVISYYHFDIQPIEPAPYYRFYRASDQKPVARQLPIFSQLPGQPPYSDFHREVRVLVDDAYVANTITSLAQIEAAGLALEMTTTLANTPLVPHGSTARSRWNHESSAAKLGWYDGKTVAYFEFETLAATQTPTSPIYVMYSTNPDEPGGGPASGFRTQDGTQTHNVVATLPGDVGYSPLWSVQILDNAAFDRVVDLASARTAPLLAGNVANVNCPVVTGGPPPVHVPTSDAELAAFVRRGDYRSFPGEPEVHASSGPHGGGVRTYLSPALQASLLSSASEHPIGAAAVKELYDGDQLQGWAVLVKVAEDGPVDQRYYWYEEIDGRVVASGREVKGCTTCHGSGLDYVLTQAVRAR